MSMEIITEKEFRLFLRVSATKFWRLKKEGRLPPAIMVTGRCRWLRGSIETWLTSQEANF